MADKVIQWERIKMKEIIPFIVTGTMFIIAPVIMQLNHPLRTVTDILLALVAFGGGITYILLPILVYKPYKIVFKDNILEIHYVNLANRYKTKVMQYDTIEVVYRSYRRSPHKNNILIRNSENKEILAWVMAHFHCSIQLNDEFSIRPDVKIIRVEMK